MIKKILSCFFMVMFSGIANANIHITGETVRRIVLEHIDSDHQVPALQEYNIQLKSTGNFTMSAAGLYKVCTAAGWDIATPEGKTKCENFVMALVAESDYKYYEICGKDKGKSGGTEHCVDNVFYAVVNGIDVQIGQATELSKEYAHVKYKDDIECSDKSRPGTVNPNNDYVKCTSKLNPVYYEFKFDDVNQSTNTEIYKDVIRGVGLIHGVDYKTSGGAIDIITLERLMNTSCAVGYDTTDVATCEKLNKSLSRFGLKSEVRNVSCASLNDNQRFCAVSYKKNECTGAADYGIDNTVFKEIQYPISQTLENYVKDYIATQLSAKNIPLSSFSCDKMPFRRDKQVSGIHVSDGSVLTCNFNDKCISFVFKDLSESANYSKNAALSRLACIKHGGASDGENCRGLNEEQCATLGEKIKASGKFMGTHYDRVRGGCILNGAVTENHINLLGEIVAGVVLTLVTDGAATIPVVVSIGTDLAFDAVNDWQRKIPYNDYQEFIQHVLSCSEDSTSALKDAVRISKINSVENKYCLSETIKKDYKLVVGQIDKLAPEDQKILADVFANIIETIGDSEYLRRASESDISLIKKARDFSSGALLAGLFLFHPEKMLSKFDDVARDIARLRYGASKNFTQHLDNFKYRNIEVGFPINRLSRSEWQALNRNLSNEGIELVERNGLMCFKRIEKTILSNIEDIARKYNKQVVFRSGASNSLGHNYYRINVNDNDNVARIIDDLQRNGFFVSSNQTTDGTKFIAISKDNIFQPWADSPTNWLKGYSGGSVRGRGIFDKVYNDMPEDVLRRKLEYIYSVKRNGGSNHDIIEAMKAVGAFDERQAGLLAEDIANETIRRISENPDLVQTGKNWRNLSDTEKSRFIDEVHDIVTRERRNRLGNTQIFHNNEGPGKLGWHRSPYGNQARGFNYNDYEFSNAEAALNTIIHENVHSFQSVYKSSIPDQFVRLSEQHYVQPKQNFNDYQNVLIEIEARYVAEHSAPKIARSLGWR